MKKHLFNNTRILFKKQTLLLLIFAGLTFGQDKKREWFSEFEFLKEQLSAGYANIDYTSSKQGINLLDLNNKTTKQLEEARSLDEAQDAIIKFIRTFKDPHLWASKIEKAKQVNEKTISKEKKLSLKDSISNDLQEMGFGKREIRYNFRYDSIAGFKTISSENNPFEAYVINTPNRRLGILKIHFFGYWRFWDVAMPLWKEYRKKNGGSCDGSCKNTFKALVEEKLTQKIIERIQQLNSKDIDALVVDVSGNGGGTEWYEEVARLFTPKELNGPKKSYVRHEHWKNIFIQHLAVVNKDLEKTTLSKGLKKHLILFRENLENSIESIENTCDYDAFSNKGERTCSLLNEHPYAFKLPAEIMNDPQFSELDSKYLLSSARFLPFKRGVYSGKLFIVQDRSSGSATEGFTSLFQLNKTGILIGENTYGAGCGYTNGGNKFELESLGLFIEIPDCVRYRADGKNEIYGIPPDIRLQWKENASSYQKGQLAIGEIMNVL